MSTTTESATRYDVDVRLLRRVLDEGYGPGAWHGPDLKAALQDVDAEGAYWRPSPGRHNIIEIALHHAYTARAVRAKLLGQPAEPFGLPGEDWFVVDDAKTFAWKDALALVDDEQRKLADAVASTKRRASSPLSNEERFGVVLGITCHAAYHAGQVQLLKRLRG